MSDDSNASPVSAGAAFREVFALYVAPVNRHASRSNRRVVPNIGARYGKSSTASCRELAVLSGQVWLMASAGRSLSQV